MKELSLHILDIVSNSITAKATRIVIALAERDGLLTLTVEDNGCGMDKDFLARVTDPFTTTRTTRKVGMGLPLLKMAAEQSDGTFFIDSTPDVGTKVVVSFGLTHIDRPPLGDMKATLLTLIQGAPDIDFLYTHEADGKSCRLDLAEVRAELVDVPLNEPEVLAWLGEFLDENDFPDSQGL